jgi:2-phosphosulfolactate phosphatase
MEIEILHLVEGAEKAKGLAVVIDVFRAFSLAAYAFGAGVKKIIPVERVETAFMLKEKNPEYILVGERNEQMIPGFDLGNSPTHIMEKELTGKTIVHTTSAGTRGLVNAMHAEQVLTGAFVNASAIVNYIKKKEPEHVSLVCMGYAAEHAVEEDTFCAEYIRNELNGIKSEFNEYKEVIKRTSALRFFDKNKQSFAPSTDFELCMNLNRFNFVLRAETIENLIILKKLKT